MTKETKVLDTTEFLSLNQSVEMWGKHILKSFEVYTRKTNQTEIKNNGFDIRNEAKKLSDYYITAREER